MHRERSDAPQRQQWVDVLRAASILLVLGLHYFGFVIETQGEFGGIGRQAAKAFGHGYFGVTLFFVISGYLIASTSLVRAPGQDHVTVRLWPFYARRITRIIPLLFAVVVLGAFFVLYAPKSEIATAIFNQSEQARGPAFWISIATFNFNWYRLHNFIESGQRGFGLHWDILWSLAIEEQFYLCFPLVVLAMGSVRRLRLVLCGVIATAVISRIYLLNAHEDAVFASLNSLTSMDALALGVLASLMPRSAMSSSAVLAGLGAVTLMMATYLAGATVAQGMATTLLALGAAILLPIVSGAKPSSRAPVAVVAKVGQLSYGLYLLHPLVLYLFAPALLSFPPVLGFVVFVALATAIAYASFALFERPVERWLRARLIRQGTPALLNVSSGGLSKSTSM